MEYIKLEDCCEILDHKRVPITASDREPGPYPYYGANGIQDYVNDYLFDDDLVLLAEDGGNFGSKTRPIAYRVSGKCWVNNHAHVLKPKENINVDYLCYALMFYNVGDMVNGATRQKLTQAAMRQMKVPYRSKDDQIRIVDFLNCIKQIIDERNNEIEALDTLIKSRFVEMFNQESNLVSVDSLCLNIVDCPHATPRYEGELKNPCIRTSEIKKGYIDWNTMKYVSDSEYITRTKRLKPEPGDIIYAREGSYGNAAILPNGYKFCLGQRTMLFRPNNEKCTPEFLLYSLLSDNVKNQADRKNNASTVPHVNVADAKKFLIQLSPIDLQRHFSDFVRQVDKSKLAIQKSLNETQLLFDSLMQEYFG